MVPVFITSHSYPFFMCHIALFGNMPDVCSLTEEYHTSPAPFLSLSCQAASFDRFRSSLSLSPVLLLVALSSLFKYWIATYE